jgi:meiotic recombination protein REC8
MTESPLIGRGSALPGNLEHFTLDNDGDHTMYGRNDDDDFQSIAAAGNSQPDFWLHPSSQRKQASTQDFELFGPAAEVDTQTAGTSQWVRQAMESESENFMDFVQKSVEEKEKDEDKVAIYEEEEGKGRGNFVTFGELLKEEQTSVVVATQAFYHILTLATRGRIWVVQEPSLRVRDGMEGDDPMGGIIRVGIVG